MWRTSRSFSPAICHPRSQVTCCTSTRATALSVSRGQAHADGQPFESAAGERGMSMGLTWQDVEDIGFELAQAHPDENPAQVELPELLQLVTDLDDFEDDPERVDEQTLARIA